MNLYDYSNVKKLYIVGDIHGEFKTLFNRIKNNVSQRIEKIEDVHPLIAEEKNKRSIDFEVGGIDAAPIAGGIFNGGAIGAQPRFAEMFNATVKASKKGKKASVPSERPYDNSVIIVAGDCGFGFNKPGYYEQIFGEVNELLAKNNCTIIFVRGNHDDPSYFTEQKINYSNLKSIPDYSVVKTAAYNVLCIGGATSVDRIWRKQEEMRINRFISDTSKKKCLYWENEPIIEDFTLIDEIVNNGININCVVTHSAPTFAYPVDKDTALSWFRIDPNLKDDLVKERGILTNIYNYLKEKGVKLDLWGYGHFHMENIDANEDGVIFRAFADNHCICNVDSEIDNWRIQEARRKEKEAKEKALREALAAKRAEEAENVPINGGPLDDNYFEWEILDNNIGRRADNRYHAVVNGEGRVEIRHENVVENRPIAAIDPTEMIDVAEARGIGRFVGFEPPFHPINEIHVNWGEDDRPVAVENNDDYEPF